MSERAERTDPRTWSPTAPPGKTKQLARQSRRIVIRDKPVVNFEQRLDSLSPDLERPVTLLDRLDAEQ